ncbi:bifunctional metallophosphatase/5'-nucleotidase [Paenibacillus thermoaerophilus]|uniref:Bifunctional metallophosphatase/5'-nucleotidase n=1 Tax=Paenibacillus thermoaerophilus TaxID=1215385 RepID=A0ABW2V0Q0_9BACL|nr:bifunctional UDP-sugar hydrolase/5'-nucleotidase [Paenibacillus thermoaerophilus]TMV16044.1 bifunctional metallophosphatase/5'-nucleotidase [Paenibacillus thermoaerophilus]
MTTNEDRLLLIHTNDIHSHFDALPRLAGAVDSLRRRRPPERTLYVDIGDHMDRMRLETEGSRGRVNIELMNRMGVEAAVPGNNEGLTMTPDELAELYGRQASFPVLACNLHAREGETPAWLRRSVVIPKGGLRIGLIGATAAFNDFYELLGWRAEEPLAAISREAAALQGQADLVIVLSHLGIALDERMADTVEGIDVIVGAHTHHLFEEPVLRGGVWMGAAGKFAQHAGWMELQLSPDRSGGRRKIERVLGGVVASSAFGSESWAEEVLARHLAAAEAALGRPFLRLDRNLPASDTMESPLGNLLADGLRRWTGAEIGLVNGGQLLRGLEAGDVSDSMLLKLCPSPINPCRMSIRGRDLLEALEESLLPEFVKLPIRGYGFRGERLGALCVSNMEIRYDPDAEPGSKLLSVKIGGAELRPDATYEVGTIDMFTFSVGYKSLARGTNRRYYLPEFIRDVLKTELQNGAALQQCAVPRWIACARPSAAKP